MKYTVSLESYAGTYAELEPLYKACFTEIADKLNEDGMDFAPYNPRTQDYADLERDGGLLTFVLRTTDGDVVGFCTVYITNDMRNQDFMAQEDAIYIMPGHRTGVGKVLVRGILMELQRRGIKRVMISALDAFRVAKIWKRMGFKNVATQMVYTFREGEAI